jgi:beta-lactamase class A
MYRSRLLSITTITISFVSVSAYAFPPVAIEPVKPYPFQEKLAELETSSGGRLGISAINTANNTRLQYRAEERFPVCSTSKMMGVAAILKQSRTKTDLLQEKINYKKEDLVVYSPVTEKHISDGMKISELCEAAISTSDNTAINLLMNKLGGPSAVTSFARSIGDNTFRLDRKEPELNSAIPDDLRDTSTPLAMEKSLQQIVLGDTLALPQRELMQTWLKGSITGNSQIRAGVAKEWIVGDKTGKGDYGTTNDIGIIWPTKCPPIVVAIYFTQNKKDAAYRDDVIASATRIMINAFAHTDPCIKPKSF